MVFAFVSVSYDTSKWDVQYFHTVREGLQHYHNEDGYQRNEPSEVSEAELAEALLEQGVVAPRN